MVFSIVFGLLLSKNELHHQRNASLNFHVKERQKVCCTDNCSCSGCIAATSEYPCSLNCNHGSGFRYWVQAWSRVVKDVLSVVKDASTVVKDASTVVKAGSKVVKAVLMAVCLDLIACI